MNAKRFLALTAFLTVFATGAFAAQTGLWQFDGDLSAQVGLDNVFLGSPAGSRAFFGKASDFGAPLLSGSDEDVLYVRKLLQETEALVVKGNVPANGGGAYCNQWTLVFDYCTTNVLTEAFTAGFHSLWDTNPDPGGGNTAGEFYIRQVTAPELGAGGQAGGYYPAYSSFADLTQWHRVACVVDARVGYMRVYVDGSLIGTFSRNQLISARPDGTYSLYTGTSGPLEGSLAMFSTGANNYNASGFINSLAIYDEPLSPSQIAELGAAAPGGIPAGVPTGDPTLVRHSEFIGYYVGDNKPYDAGDVTTAWAINGTFMGDFGWYRYFPDYGGSLRINHPPHDWDDPYIDVETTGTIDVYNPIAVDESLEAVVKIVPVFNPAGAGQFIEVMFTDRGLAWNLGSGASDVHMKLWCDNGTDLWIAASGNPANDGTWLLLDDIGTSVTEVELIINYDAPTTTWRLFYRIDTTEGPGVLREVPDGPIVKLRTKTAFRVESEQQWGYTTVKWDMYITDLKIYNEVKTEGAECITGETRRHSTFNSPAGSVAGNFFYPLTVAHDVDQMFIPAPATHEYTGTAWEVVHSGSNTLFPNAGINFSSLPTDSTEWQVAVDTNFTSQGAGQMFNMKIDGNPVSYFLGNFGNTASLMFGEDGNIFSPNPANVAVLPVAADQINEMLLIINYDSVLEEYNAYYSINGGALQMHPSSGYPLLRGTNDGAKVEFQWQVWNGSPTDAFSVAIDDYLELCGVVTAPPLSVPDFWLFE